MTSNWNWPGPGSRSGRLERDLELCYPIVEVIRAHEVNLSRIAGGAMSVVLDPRDEGLIALVDAIHRLENDEPLRSRLVARGLEVARGLTLEAEAERVGGFLRGAGI